MTTPTPNAASERELFEAWCVDPQRDLYLERLGLGYFHPVTSMLWECWQAARRTPVAESSVREWQPIETAPADTEVIVFWLDPESPKNPERYDFDMLDDGCWRQWTDHYEWAHSVAPAGSRMPREQAPYTHWKSLGAPTTEGE